MTWTRDNECRLRIALAVVLGLVLAAIILLVVYIAAVAPRPAATEPGDGLPPPMPSPGLALSRMAGSVPVGGPPRADTPVPARGITNTMGGCGLDRAGYAGSGKWPDNTPANHKPVTRPWTRRGTPASRPSLFKVTAYCPCRRCCGQRACGVTASGSRADHPLVAAPKSIPFDTVLVVPGYGTVKVEDRGGAITEGRLDVLMPTHAEARAWGVKHLEVGT